MAVHSFILPFLLSWLVLLESSSSHVSAVQQQQQHASVLGDPGMRSDGLRVAFEAWNFCNEVGAEEAPGMGSPRLSDCFEYLPGDKNGSHSTSSIVHRVTEADNKLGVGTPFPGLSPGSLHHPDLYAAEKELYLGSLCEAPDDSPDPWQFWMVMLKNGNFDTRSGLCPENGKRVGPFEGGGGGRSFPCYGTGCMNQPAVYHRQTYVSGYGAMRGWFNGTYDLGGGGGAAAGVGNLSYFEVVWEKEAGAGRSWVFRHRVATTRRYPWLMLYLRADATRGFSGGYHYQTRGMLKTLPESPNFKVRLSLDVKQGGGPKSQFYLVDIGSCWKNDGSVCDGDTTTDVTRYSEMIINPETRSWCSPRNLRACPPFHTTPDGRKIHRNDTASFPYSAYHYYCSPGNARHLEEPVSLCDPYSNPQPQELVQLLPHPVWSHYGFPSESGEGWIGDPRTWELDVGSLSSNLYFYQDPGTAPARRIWTSIDVGTEIFVSEDDEVAEWSLSDFDVIVPR